MNLADRGWDKIGLSLYKCVLYVTLPSVMCTVGQQSCLIWPKICVTWKCLLILYFLYLKLPSLFAAWPFWTFHNKSHYMKALVILSHSWPPFLPLTFLMEQMNFCGSLCCLLEYFREKNSLKITQANHMIMTISGQI